MRALAVALALMSVAHADEGRLQRAEREMARGHRLMDAHDYAGALEHFEEARALAPESSGPYLGVGLASSALGRCPVAVPALEEYLRKKRESPSPLAQPALDACREKLAPPPAPSPAPRPGSLRVEGLPIGAEVRVDDPAASPAGRIPIDLTLAPGPHTIYLSHDGYRAGRVDVTIAAGQSDRIAPTLEILPPPPPRIVRGRLEVYVEPPPVTVYLNSDKMPGTGPTFGAELPPGIYRLTIEKEGYEKEYRDVWVRSGEKNVQKQTFAPKMSLARRRAITAVAVVVPLVAIALGVGLGVGLTRPQSSSSSSGGETGLGTLTVP